MRLYMPLTLDEFEKLCNLARKERRSPREQAAMIIGQALGIRLSATVPNEGQREWQRRGPKQKETGRDHATRQARR